MHLHAVNGQTGTCVQPFVTNVTFEMLCLLVHNQNLLILELPVAIPAPGLGNLLLLTAHVAMSVLGIQFQKTFN